MKCGRLSAIKATNSGFGSPLMSIPAKLLGFRSAITLNKERGSFGLRCLVSTVSVLAYTDFWRAYALVLPDKRHQAVGKETGKTSYIERFNCTMRQRVSRLVRKTLSFSKKLENHIGAIWLFVHHYNLSLPV
jgi:IS1 family transposase